MTTQRQPREITPELVADALACINPDNLTHDERARLGFAVFDQFGANGADYWMPWAARRSGSVATEDAATWRSVCKPGKVKINTLFYVAKRHGFRFPKPDHDGTTPRAGRPVPTADELAAQHAERERRDAEEAAALEADHLEAATRCRAMWDVASDTPPGERLPVPDPQGCPVARAALPGRRHRPCAHARRCRRAVERATHPHQASDRPPDRRSHRGQVLWTPRPQGRDDPFPESRALPPDRRCRVRRAGLARPAAGGRLRDRRHAPRGYRPARGRLLRRWQPAAHRPGAAGATPGRAVPGLRRR